MTIRLTTLGHPRVALGDLDLSTLPGKPVTFGVFVFMAVEQEVTRDRLVAVFWPDSPQEKARHALSQTLYEIRQILGEEGVESSGNTVRPAEGLWVDCLEFTRLAEAARNAEALALYGGPFLDGVYLAQTHPFEEWVERTRARLARRHRAVVDPFISQCRLDGELERALEAAWKWVSLDPLDDGGQQHLIQLLAETGSRTEALSQFDRYEAMLQEELGLEPLEETLGLVEAIRAGDLPPASPSVEGIATVSGTSIQANEGEAGALSTSDEGQALPAETGPPGKPPGELPGGLELQKRMESELSPSLEILRPIGQGTMAEVFLAREPHLRRLVAVKVLSPELSSDPRARKRFEREAQSAARIQSPHVCTVHRVGTLSDGTPFLVSPFVKGTSLGQRLKAEGRLDPQEVRTVLREVSAALAAAHKIGIVHRDVRPDNILRADETGRHSLCDFGIAGVLETGEQGSSKLTKTGEILGHPSYMSPEQMDGLPLTDRADIYSLGVLGHQLLTGHPPHALEEKTRRSRGSGAAVDLRPLEEFLQERDPELATLIGRCLAEDPAHRPRAADLEAKLSHRSVSSQESGRPPITEVRLGHLLFRKRLPHILGGYLASAWAALEAAGFLEGRNVISPVLTRAIMFSIPFGFLAASVVGWFHGEKGRQDMPLVERWLLGVLGVAWLAVVIWVVGSDPRQ